MTRALAPLEEHLSSMVQLAKQKTPLGWEASIRIGPQGVSPWRYLVGFAHDGAPTSFLDSLLAEQAMPTAFSDAFSACLPWTASILFSVAPSRSDTELRVYKEYAPDVASEVAMRGFKWVAGRSGVRGHEGARMTNYSASALSQLDDMLHQVSDRLLNWVSVGLDTRGLPFISLYFTATEDDVLVAASHSHRRAA